MKVVHKITNEILGTVSSLEEIVSVSTKHLFEPFVKNHNYFIYVNDQGQFGLACPKTHVLREVLIHEKAY